MAAEVVSGGVYARAHSVSSSRVAPSSFVTVIGRQLKPVASSCSEISVTVVVAMEISVVSLVVVTVIVLGGHGRQKPSVPQYAIDLQHSVSQQVVSSEQEPFSQHFSDSGW